MSQRRGSELATQKPLTILDQLKNAPNKTKASNIPTSTFLGPQSGKNSSEILQKLLTKTTEVIMNTKLPQALDKLFPKFII
jgi:hypothetical protein